MMVYSNPTIKYKYLVEYTGFSYKLTSDEPNVATEMTEEIFESFKDRLERNGWQLEE